MPYHINPTITKPPNTTIDQFMVTAVTGTAAGKNEKTTEMTRKMMLNPFVVTPIAAPIFHGPYRIGSALIFLIIKRMIGMR